MRFSTSRELATYWQALRRGRAIPDVRDFDPTAVSQAMTASFITQRRHDDFLVIETTEGFCEFFGTELRDGSVLSISQDGARDAWRDLLRSASDGAPTVLGAIAVNAAGERPMEILLLPLLRMQAPVAILLLGAVASAPQTPPCSGRLTRILSHRVLTAPPTSPVFGRRSGSTGCRNLLHDLRRRTGATFQNLPQKPEETEFFERRASQAQRQGRFYVIDGS